MTETTQYELHYWPGIPGRGEFVRLVLEDADVPYSDVARLPEDEGGGIAPLIGRMRGQGEGFPVFAPPILVVKSAERRDVIAQTANVCHFVAVRHGLAPSDDIAQAQCLTLMLTVADVAREVHDLHHPISAELYYDDQKEAALGASRVFVDSRMEKWLGYFETVLERGDGHHLIGTSHSYVDLGVFQMLEGLAYQLPKAFAHHTKKTPKLVALRQRVAERPRVAAYRSSERCLAFNEDGLFRHYPELDLEPNAS